MRSGGLFCVPLKASNLNWACKEGVCPLRSHGNHRRPTQATLSAPRRCAARGAPRRPALQGHCPPLTLRRHRPSSRSLMPTRSAWRSSAWAPSLDKRVRTLDVAGGPAAAASVGRGARRASADGRLRLPPLFEVEYGGLGRAKVVRPAWRLSRQPGGRGVAAAPALEAGPLRRWRRRRRRRPKRGRRSARGGGAFSSAPLCRHG